MNEDFRQQLDVLSVTYYNVIRGGKIMVVSIRMTEEEKALATSYAKIRGMSLSEAIKRAYFEAIEDEYDVVLAERAMKEYEEDPTTISHEEMRKALGL